MRSQKAAAASRRVAKRSAIQGSTPRALLAAGYQIVKSEIAGGGVALLLRKGTDLVLFRLAEYREGGDPVHGSLVVQFVAKVP